VRGGGRGGAGWALRGEPVTTEVAWWGGGGGGGGAEGPKDPLAAFGGPPSKGGGTLLWGGGCSKVGIESKAHLLCVCCIHLVEPKSHQVRAALGGNPHCL